MNSINYIENKSNNINIINDNINDNKIIDNNDNDIDSTDSNNTDKNVYDINFYINELLKNCNLSGEYYTIVASVSKTNPNYFYEWIRDSAIIIDMLLNLVKRKYISYKKVHLIFNNYVYNHLHFQNICIYEKYSHGVTLSLGEPKMNINGSPYNKEWGRPQNDGPALRSMAMIKYVFYLLKYSHCSKNFITKTLYDSKWPISHTIIKRDLEYICNNYTNTCFDLWEEINGHHYYTLMVQKKALQLGAKLAMLMGDNGAVSYYSYIVANIDSFIKSKFYKNNRIISSIGITNKQINYREHDMSVLLSFLHTNTEYNAELINTICDMIEIFRKEYIINNVSNNILMNTLNNTLNITKLMVGRYPNDEYYNGNPWVLTTAALATFLLKIDLTKIDTNKLDHKFYRIFEVSPETQITIIHDKIKNLGKKIIESLIAIEKYNNKKKFQNEAMLSFSEQINKKTFIYLSADHLTWNYVEMIRAVSNMLK